MKKKALAFTIFVILLISINLLAGCSGLFSMQERSDYYIKLEDMNDLSIGSVVANNCISSCVRVLTTFNTTSTINRYTTASAGFLISKDGYLITNSHSVVEENKVFNNLTTNIEIVFANNTKTVATIIANNADIDIAVLKINTINEHEFLTFADSDDIFWGQNAFTIGNPENVGIFISTAMIANPRIKLRENPTIDTILLDSTINHGNSGGALINFDSKVIGVVFSRIETQGKPVNETYGIGCAIPSNAVMDYLDTLDTLGIGYTVQEK